MLNVTPTAAEQIRKSAENTGATGMALRIAVSLEEDGSFAYGMGFDERRDDDVRVPAEGVEIVFATRFKEALMGAELDYVELNPGEFQFIFRNPNDPAHSAPKTP